MAMSAGGDGELNSEINVTPMVDIMLVLLIIFMITAPMMNTGVDVDLPKVTAKDIEDPEGKLILAIDKTQSLHLGGTRIQWNELAVKLSTNEKVKSDSALYIDADQALPYGIVVTAMAVAKNAGVEKVMMMTEAADDATLATTLQKLDTGVPQNK
jgi:biopolymer transport protein TolR